MLGSSGKRKVGGKWGNAALVSPVGLAPLSAGWLFSVFLLSPHPLGHLHFYICPPCVTYKNLIYLLNFSSVTHTLNFFNLILFLYLPAKVCPSVCLFEQIFFLFSNM